MDIDLDLLAQLIDLLKAGGIDEFRQGDLHLRFGRGVPGVDGTATVTSGPQATKQGIYAQLFGGRVPSFDDFKAMGGVTEEQG